jgi:Flp pilus assembly protein TadD
MALLRRDRGQLGETARLRSLAGGKGDAGDITSLVDAELAVVRGMPDAAVDSVAARTDRRARVVRFYALLDLGRPADALIEIEAAQRLAPHDRRITAYVALAHARAGDDADAEQALATLEKLADSDAVARLLLGEALLARGQVEEGRRQLEDAKSGHPLAYRALVRLAELDLAAYDEERRKHGADPKRAARSLAGVEEQLRQALEQAPENLPARALLGRYFAAVGDPVAAVAALTPVAAADRSSAADDLALAQSLAAGGDRERARELVRRAAAKGAPKEDLLPVARDVDQALAEELSAQ